MTVAEGLYRILLWLYPPLHRRTYGLLMLQHARDLGRAARRRGRWRLATCCLYLAKDAIINASIEQLEAIKMADQNFKPIPWISVILVCIPGLLFATARSYTDRLDTALTILGYVYLLLLVIGLPISWRRNRQFPVWGLLPVGILAWWFTYFGGVALSRLFDSLPLPGLRPIDMETWTLLIDLLVVMVLFLIVLRGQRLPRSFWLLLAGIALINFLAAIFLLEWDRYDNRRLVDILYIFSIAGFAFLDGLMLVAVGSLAARQYGHLALLVIIGGYSCWFLDADYLWLNPSREWAGITPYLVVSVILFMVVAPLALLRARTRLGRALAVFVPAIIFNIARLTLPSLVYDGPFNILTGDIMLSLNMLLFLALAWILYDHLGEAARLPVTTEQPDEQGLEQTASVRS